MKSQRKALKSYRLRQKRQGIARVEVRVRKEDASLVRDVVKALCNPEQAREARAVIRTYFGTKKPDFKEYLMMAPLEGVDLTRPLDYGRDIEL
jgi:hypothetical protein